MSEIKIRSDDASIRIVNVNRLKAKIIQNVLYKAKNTAGTGTDDTDDSENYTYGTVSEAAEEFVSYVERAVFTRKEVKSAFQVEEIPQISAETEKTKTEMKTGLLRKQVRIGGKSQVTYLDSTPEASAMPVHADSVPENVRVEAAREAAKRSIVQAKRTAETADRVISVISDVYMRAARAVRNAADSMMAALVAGGGVTIAAVVVICLTGLLVASPLGIFLSGETGAGKTIQMVVQEINTEFYTRINDIKKSVPYDDLKISGRGASWTEVLAVYAVETSMSEESGQEVATVSPEKEQLLRTIFWEMNSISYSTEEYTEIVTVETENEDGETEEEEQEEERLRLLITVRNKAAEDTAEYRSFSGKQRDMYAELMSDRFSSLWARMVGGYSLSLGFVPSDATWVGTGSFIWPLPVNGSITSGYGYRADPFTGETKFHGGIDIAAAEGTPVLAADDGVVETANGSDSWGGGYGFYVKIGHGNGYETLYGHCSSICVIAGQNVQKGEVIAYVGSTGNSTGNHLHFEIIANGDKMNPIAWFY